MKKTMKRNSYDVTDLGLAAKGRDRIRWAGQHMPVLALIQERFAKKKPLKGLRLAACLHVTSETANLMMALRAGGAQVTLCASNPLSTQDDVAASLVRHAGIPVFACRGENRSTYYAHIRAVLDRHPHITMDDGADLVSELHTKRKSQLKEIIGGSEETTTGVIRLRSMEAQNVLAYPIIAVNDANTKHLFDNRYGTGQSTIDGIVRATNILLAGLNVVVCGYGMCGRGVAMRAQGMGANVIVVEVDPLRGLEAVMDGYRVMPIAEAARLGDVFVTVTGDCAVLRGEHFRRMKDGAIICNAGHFDVEIEIPSLVKMAKSRRTIRHEVEEFVLRNGKRLYLLAQGRLVNLAAAEGHPASVMDMSFANQSLCAAFLAKNYHKLEKRVYPVPEDIDREIAALKLKAMGIKIDKLTPEQAKYLGSWTIGT